MIYKENDILYHVGPRALAAGRLYQKHKRVLAFENKGETIFAKVQGNEKRPYEQRILITFSASGRVTIASECSCPVSQNCKHVAAALFEKLERASAPYASRTSSLFQLRNARNSLEAPPADPKSHNTSTLPPELVSWLQALEKARHVDQEDYPSELHQRIVYIFSAKNNSNLFPRLELKIVTTRLLKNGAFSSNTHNFEPRSALSSQFTANYLRPSDFRIFRKITLAQSEYGAQNSKRNASFATDEALELIGEIVATNRARWLDVNAPTLALGPPQAGKIVWDVLDNASMRPRIDLDAGLIALNAAPPVYIDPVAGLIGPIDVGLSTKLAHTLLDAPLAAIEHVDLLGQSFVNRLPDLSRFRPPTLSPPEILTKPPQFVLRLMLGEMPQESWEFGHEYRRRSRYHDDDIMEPVGIARLIFRYGPVDVALSEITNTITRYHNGGLKQIQRDHRAERDALATLHASGFVSVHEMCPLASYEYFHDFLPAEPTEFAWFNMLCQNIPRLRKNGWIIEIDPDFPIQLIDGAGDFSLNLHETTGVDWLELDLGVSVDGETIDLVEPIISLIAAPHFDIDNFVQSEGESEPFYLRLADGRFLTLSKARIAPFITAICELICGSQNFDKSRRLRVSLMDAASLANLEHATLHAGAIWLGGEKLREMGKKLTAAGGLPRVTLPKTFAASLRPYQAQGVAWLAFMREVGLGGVLADDMGLGKTVQALALIALEKAAGRLKRPALVIAPTSLMTNWRCEAEKFSPDLRVVILQGSDRKKRFEAIDEADLVLSTYPLIARDHETLSAREWSLLILDEAQTIKNPNAVTTRLIRSLTSNGRFCLTGTPLENHLGELWSIFSFALPGFLGDLSVFTQSFRTPIEKKGDTQRAKLLAARVKPFLLRRTKDEVAKELPPKTEIIERVEMPSAQRDIYESIRLAMHEKVRSAIAAKGFSRSQIIILDALLKLRQCCCDPRLLKLAKKATVKAGSAKLDRLMEMLMELVNEDRRVLVFSQFTSMLDLIRDELDNRDVSYSLLTGETRDRAKQIDDFQNARNCIFLISLKAGGIGLNLTAADTVILYDPWWNPAVESQAIDRAHRIGQNRPVFVHKLIVSGTIEEKMEVLKEKKRSLAKSLFDSDGASTLGMTEADLEMLFS